MKNISIYKAQEIYKGQNIENLTITFDETIPEYKHEDLAKLYIIFQEQAELLQQSLSAILPGGVYDRLLGFMMKRRASSFIVPLFDKDNKLVS